MIRRTKRWMTPRPSRSQKVRIDPGDPIFCIDVDDLLRVARVDMEFGIMRCLFIVEEIARFREVAVAFDSRDVAMTMVRASALAERLANAAGFDIVIVGANTVASEAMRFLQRRRLRRCPIIAVTEHSELRRPLVDAGADRVVLLPDTDDELKRALSLLVDASADVPVRASRRARLWQHLGL